MIDSISAILHSIRCDDNNNNNDNNNSFVFGFFLYLMLLFFDFIRLFQRRMPTNAWLIYFSIKRWSDNEIWKIKFSTLKLKIKHQLNIVTQVLGLISWRPEWLNLRISIQLYLLWLSSRTNQFLPTTIVFCFVLLMVI